MLSSQAFRPSLHRKHVAERRQQWVGIFLRLRLQIGNEPAGGVVIGLSAGQFNRPENRILE